MKKWIAFLIIFLFVSIFAVFIILNEEQKKEYYENYGKDKAVSTPLNYVDCDIVYNIYQLKTFSNQTYYNQAKTAIKCASKVLKEYTGYTITYSESRKSSNGYDIKATEEKIYDGEDEINAKNTLNSYTWGPVISSHILCSNAKMWNYQTNGVLHILIHELGHTLGLKDLYEEGYEKNSIMYGNYNLLSDYTFTDFTDFDKRNIKYIYKELVEY